MGEIVHGDIGSEVKYDLKFEDLKLKFEMKRVGGLGDEQLVAASLPAAAVLGVMLDGLDKLIPGDQKSMFDAAKAFIVGILPK
jgi:hypothetical protein